MARGINKVILIGNCGRDPEKRTLPSGASVTDVSLATTTSWNDRATGARQERTEWHRVVFFAPLADIVAQYAKKGTPLYIEGSLRYRESEKDGVKRYYTDIVAREMQLLGGRDGAGAPSESHSTSYAQAPAPKASESQPLADFDDDLPF